MVSGRLPVHGMSEKPTHHCWVKMQQRCFNQNDPKYRDYGGRGITVCQRWRKFEAFLADMGERPSSSHSIDRINVNGNYEPGNCRWATRIQQMRNTRRNHKITFKQMTLCLAEWEERTGIDRRQIVKRLNRGWSVEQALTLPVGTRIKNRWDRHVPKASE